MSILNKIHDIELSWMEKAKQRRLKESIEIEAMFRKLGW